MGLETANFVWLRANGFLGLRGVETGNALTQLQKQGWSATLLREDKQPASPKAESTQVNGVKLAENNALRDLRKQITIVDGIMGLVIATANFIEKGEGQENDTVYELPTTLEQIVVSATRITLRGTAVNHNVPSNLGLDHGYLILTSGEIDAGKRFRKNPPQPEIRPQLTNT